jgi:Flp pilus assembly protein TadB
VRSLLGALVVAATVAFVVGTALERSSGETRATRSAEAAEGQGEGHTDGAAERHAEAPGHRAELRPLGIDVEAAPFVALVAVASLALALAAWLRPRAAALLALVAAAMLAFAVLDVREVFHQVDESRAGLAMLAGAVAALHVSAAVVAGRMAR